MTQESTIANELDRLATEFIEATDRRFGTLPTAPADSEWQSVAITGTADSARVYWQPTRRHQAFSLEGLSRALETNLPPSFSDYFGHFWSGSIPVVWGERHFELLQLWNADDENNLMHNLLGHSLEKQRVREPLTLFFALVDDARFLSVDVASGAVMLEEVGGTRPEEVAADLATLLASISALAELSNDT